MKTNLFTLANESTLVGCGGGSSYNQVTQKTIEQIACNWAGRIGFMINKLVVVSLLVLASMTVNASTMCVAVSKEDDLWHNVAVLSYDFETMTAKYKATYGDTYEGKITNVRKFNKVGQKINFEFEVDGNLNEFVLFPAFGKYRAIGIQFTTENGQKLVDVSLGNTELNCTTI
jgi:hypothetical protein